MADRLSIDSDEFRQPILEALAAGRRVLLGYGVGAYHLVSAMEDLAGTPWLRNRRLPVRAYLDPTVLYEGSPSPDVLWHWGDDEAVVPLMGWLGPAPWPGVALWEQDLSYELVCRLRRGLLRGQRLILIQKPAPEAPCLEGWVTKENQDHERSDSRQPARVDAVPGPRETGGG